MTKIGAVRMRMNFLRILASNVTDRWQRDSEVNATDGITWRV